MSLSCLAVVRRTFSTGIAVLFLALPAMAQAASLGALEPYLLLGGDPPWAGSMEGDSYRLTNATNDADIVYFVAALPGGRAQEVSVNVSVQPQIGAAYSGAGLIFNFDSNSRTYLALVLMATGELAIYQRDNQGVSELARLPTTGIAVEPLRLSLRTTAEGLTIEANGTHQGSIGGVGLQGQAGILAIDGGSYLFSDYSVR